MDNAYYSVITPEGCAAILWKDRKYAPQAADALQLTAAKLYELGIADAIIPEPEGGAHRDIDGAAKNLGDALAAHLEELCQSDGETLKNNRYEKFRAFGCFDTAPIQQELPEIEDPEEKGFPQLAFQSANGRRNRYRRNI